MSSRTPEVKGCARSQIPCVQSNAATDDVLSEGYGRAVAPGGRRRTVVVGAGIGGLCAAAALSHTADEVILIERDRLPTAPVPRRGVAQASQLHNLLGAAQAHLEALLPGFLDELLSAGAMRGCVSTDTHVYELGVRMPERDLGLAIICAPRPLIEHVARRLLLTDERVRVQDGTAAAGIVINEGTLQGVLVADIATGATEMLDAEIVVDATGTASPAPKWLGTAGYHVPEEVRRIGQWYATALYAKPARDDLSQRFWLVFPTPPRSRGGLVSPVGPSTLNVSLNGGPSDPPPRTQDEFEAYARSLEDPAIGELLASSTAQLEPTVFRRMFATWRHYERMITRPPGFLPIGDAFATLNPLFGQGMSVAAAQGSVLAALVEASGLDDLEGLTRHYLEQAAAAVQAAWDLGALVESGTGWRHVVTDRDAALRLGRLLVDDPELHRTYVGIWHLLEPMSALDFTTVLEDPLRVRPQPGRTGIISDRGP
jgi:flavin-dependent dehydrogenase